MLQLNASRIAVSNSGSDPQFRLLTLVFFGGSENPSSRFAHQVNKPSPARLAQQLRYSGISCRGARSLRGETLVRTIRQN